MKSKGKLRRANKKEIIIQSKNGDNCSKVFSCSFNQFVPFQVWSSGFHRNKRFVAESTLKYLLDNNYFSSADLLFFLLDNKLVSDFSVFGLLMKWGARK